MTSSERKSHVQSFETRTEAANAAATAVASELRRLIASHGRAVAVFDAFTQPVEFFDRLVNEPGIDWTQVIAFQAGEYVGERPASAASRQRFLTEHLVLRVPIVSFQPLRGDAANPSAAATNFSEQLAATPPDLAFVSFQLLDSKESDRPSEEAVGFTRIGDRMAIAITPRALLRCPRLFALGATTAPQGAERHANASIFLSINP